MHKSKIGITLLFIFLVGALASGVWLIVSSRSAQGSSAGLADQEGSNDGGVTAQPTDAVVQAVSEEQGAIGNQEVDTLLIVPIEPGWVYLVQGSQVEPLQISSDYVQHPLPVLSPDGTRIAYRNPDGYLALYEISSQETTVYAEVDVNGFWPIGWSPDGLQIAYSQSAAPAAICIYTLSTAQNVCYSDLANDPVGSYGGYSFAGWSQDGMKMGLLFLSDPGEHLEGEQTYLVGSIHLLDLADQTVTEVVNEADLSEIEHVFSAMLSPDGTTFLFSARSEAYDAIYRVNVDGTGLTRITPDTLDFDIQRPVWHPDGSRFVAMAPDLDPTSSLVYALPTVFDLSGQLVEQIRAAEGGEASSWINQ